MNISNKVGFTLMFSFLLLPVQVYAHGTEAEHQREMMMSTYVFIGTSILFTLFFVLYQVTKNIVKDLTDVKKAEEREKRLQLTKTVQRLKWAWMIALIGIAISGGMILFDDGTSGMSNLLEGDKPGGMSGEASEIMLDHAHGLGYSRDGRKIFIPAHSGLRVYSEGRWSIPEGGKHDYMGFSMVDDGFYSSGHPAPGSGMMNPFGIVKSTDEGKTIQTLDLKGESDFHSMAAGYKTHVIYVLNTEANSRMEGPGLYYTKDEAKTWVKSKMKGIQDDSLYDHMALVPIATHPTKDHVVAIGTQSGLYLSTNYGDNFKKVLSDLQVTSLYFNDEGTLYVGGYKNEPFLLEMNIETKEKKKWNLPTLKEDAIAYVAQNPVKAKEMAMITFKKDVYVTEDQGLNWTKIADQGKALSANSDK
ncbi:hypothetical protein BSNK01_22890 [Bacillaceae bacterium]